jgi:hypothetical protein
VLRSHLAPEEVEAAITRIQRILDDVDAKVAARGEAATFWDGAIDAPAAHLAPGATQAAPSPVDTAGIRADEASPATPEPVVEPEPASLTGESSPLPSPASGPVRARLPGLAVSRHDLHTTPRWTSKEWRLDFHVTMPDGSRRWWGECHVLIDENRLPIGPPEFFLEARVHHGGESHALHFYDEVVQAPGDAAPSGVGKRVKATDHALDEMMAGYKEAFDTVPNVLHGDLIMDNKLAFQKAFATHRAEGMSRLEAAQRAIHATPFAQARDRLGYSQFEVVADMMEPVDLGPPLGVQDVPTEISASARRSIDDGQ